MSLSSLRREYPIAGILPGWYFRVKEVSFGCYVAEGQDTSGRTVSRKGLDAEALLAQAVCDAKEIIESSSQRGASRS